MRWLSRSSSSRLRPLGWLVGFVLIGVLQATAHAGSLEIEPPAEPLSCLTSTRPSSSLPTYPTAAVSGTDAVVRVKLLFTAPDAGPRPEIFFNNAGEPFADAVREHVAAYRLPCLGEGKSFTGTQEFQFVTKDSRPAVLESATRDANGDVVWPEECLAGISNVPPPNWPTSLWGIGEAVRPANLLVELIFVGPDAAPVAKVLYDGSQPRLRTAVLGTVSAYRLQCMKAGDPPVVTRQTFHFKFDDEDDARQKPRLTLPQLVRGIKDLDRQRVRFDFKTMGCPFEVVVEPYQPYALNHVHEGGARRADRREFIEWLRNVTFDLPPDIMRTALGHSTTVSVPCALLELS